MCKLLCFEGNHCKNMQTNEKNTGFGGFCGKNVDNDSLAWEAPTGGKSEKSTHWKDPGGGEIVALDGPGCGWL